MTSVALVIPFRDRGRDPLRAANLDAVLRWWKPSPWPVLVVDDGRTGDEQFSRSASYNRGAEQTDADVIVYTESDMLLPFEQIEQAVALAAEKPGLVVGFDQYRYMSPADSEVIRGDLEPEKFRPESTMDNGRSIGAVNVVSRETLAMVGGYDERFAGGWYDDSSMFLAFEGIAGPTRWVQGPAYHLYHLPTFKGDHRTAEDIAQTARNKARYRLYQQAKGNPEALRELVTGVR